MQVTKNQSTLVPFLICFVLSFLRKTDHFSEDYKQVLSQISSRQSLGQLYMMIVFQAVREREMSTNREISGIDNVAAYSSRYSQHEYFASKPLSRR